MDAATLQRVFEPFFTTKPLGKDRPRDGHGTRLMNQHGGYVHVTASRQGTSVRLCFQVATATRRPRKSDVQTHACFV